jgi:hypothetical protein
MRLHLSALLAHVMWARQPLHPARCAQRAPAGRVRLPASLRCAPVPSGHATNACDTDPRMVDPDLLDTVAQLRAVGAL